MAYKDSFKVDGGKVTRNASCPKCGTGFLLANHKDRKTCGRCKYVEFTSEK